MKAFVLALIMLLFGATYVYGQNSGCESLYVDATTGQDSTGHPTVIAWATTTDLATSGSTGCPIGQQMASNHFAYTHKYATRITLNSPKGRSITLLTNGQEAGRAGVGSNTATTGMDICDPSSDTPTNCDNGDYTYNGTESTNCTFAGYFYNGVIGSRISITVRLTVTYGYNDLPSIIGAKGDKCGYTAVCTQGVPTCGNPTFYVQQGEGESCSEYVRNPWAVLVVNGKSTCLVGLTIPASGPGPCN